jgi:hypothetical protein
LYCSDLTPGSGDLQPRSGGDELKALPKHQPLTMAMVGLPSEERATVVTILLTSQDCNRTAFRSRPTALKEEMNAMGFYGPEPFDTAEVTYVWTGLGEPGFFIVTVKGNVRNFTSGITLVRDSDWVGGLAIKVMGWTGPLGQGTRPYMVTGVFPGDHLDYIVVIGSNKTVTVPVKEIPFTTEEAYTKLAGAISGGG